MSEISEAEGVLYRNGFVRCDIAACNCGSWHARYGLPERFAELNQAMSDAGEQLNGVTLLGAVQALIAERDTLRKDAERWRKSRRLLATKMFDYDLLEGEPESAIDTWVDAALAVGAV